MCNLMQNKDEMKNFNYEIYRFHFEKKNNIEMKQLSFIINYEIFIYFFYVNRLIWF